MDLLPKLTGESSSDEGDESDVYSPPASTDLNSSSGLSDNDLADVNDLEEESGSQPEVLLGSNEDGGCYSSFDLSSIYAVKYHLTMRIRLYQLSFLISTIPGPRYCFPAFSDLSVI